MPKSNLIIDEGNTLCKFAIVDNGIITDRAVGTNADDGQLQEFASRHQIGRIISSTTRSTEVKLPAPLQRIPHVKFSTDLHLPVSIDYKTPETLGSDRIAAAAGAATLYPGRNTLIIDIGTAITIDFLTADGVFNGGIISPGPEMRAKALHHFTGRLPLVEITGNAQLQGKSTTEAIQSGIANGISFEIEGYIERYRKTVDNLLVIAAGGFAGFFFRNNTDIKIEPDLVLTGMNRILEMNI
ncbi:MAG: type III pantothenate kinase [Salinivirgaceae bacterium]|nr:type III pantothenate kinase [Salinivirgaceae bacterium]